MANAPDNPPSSHPLSLERIKAAFARMASPGGAGDDSTEAAAEAAKQADDAVDLHAIIEGVLFVGGEGDPARTAEELAAALRDVTPEEVARAVDELNERYDRDAAPCHIEATPAGYRLRLDDDLTRLRDKFHGRVREAKLTPAALEVLSVVAYRQPTTAATVDKLRGARSGGLLANLVRRQLVRVDLGPDSGADTTKQYRTTDRFLRLFGLEDLDQLPRAAELD